MTDRDNADEKSQTTINIENEAEVITIPTRYVGQVLQMNGMDINDKILKVEKLGEVRKKLCYYFQKGRCEKGARCQFPHVKKDATREQQRDTKNIKCKFFVRGACTNNPCRFLHPKCRNFQNNIRCRYDKNCMFLC